MGGGGGGDKHTTARKPGPLEIIQYSLVYMIHKFLAQVASPTSKSSRSDSRTSFGSIFETPAKEKSSERVSLSH